MRTKIIKNIEELAEIMHEHAHDGISANAILFYDDAIKLMSELLAYQCITPEAFDIAPPEWDAYDKEYIVELSSSDMTLSIERACRDGVYLYCGMEEDITYIDNDASSKIHDKISGHCISIDFNDSIPLNIDCKYYKDDDCTEDETSCESELDFSDEELDELLKMAELLKSKSGGQDKYKPDLNLFIDYLFGD